MIRDAEGKPCRCDSCRFYDPFNEGDDNGHCRRHAPRAAVWGVQESTMVSAEWPIVIDKDWCGAWTYQINQEGK